MFVALSLSPYHVHARNTLVPDSRWRTVKRCPALETARMWVHDTKANPTGPGWEMRIVDTYSGEVVS
jgi:hypothetical protein